MVACFLLVVQQDGVVQQDLMVLPESEPGLQFGWIVGLMDEAGWQHFDLDWMLDSVVFVGL